MTAALELPPRSETADGRGRRVGVEIEFGGLEARPAAEVVRAMFGGEVVEKDKHRFRVEGTALGDFEVELDSIYAHPDKSKLAAGGKLRELVQSQVAAAVGDVASLWLPYEVVAPPLPLDRLPDLDRLVGELARHQAKGTRDNLLYGFGLQLNPEVASTETDDITRHLQAYLVLSPWLREQIDVDPTRRLLPFVDQFPERYVRRVVDPGYRPDLAGLIEDYLADNATRNRELDMLPLFFHLDPERIRQTLDDPLIKGRPTFHYRLPNSEVGQPGWGGVIGEWNRWVRVERLADDRDRLREACRAYAARLDAGTTKGWAREAERWALP